MFSDELSGFWSLWITVLTIIVIAGCWWVLYANRKSSDSGDDNQLTGHVADGIEEYDNPLPRWWFMMFVGTLVFGIGYLILYPGLGNFKGVLGWTSDNQWEAEMVHADEFYAPIFDEYAKISIEDLAQDGDAMKVANRIYQNNCAICHGSNATGGYQFPDLTNNSWLYGGEPEEIRETIIKGRNGFMASWSAMLGEEGTDNMAHYVLSLSGLEHDAAAAEEAAPMFDVICAACHGENAKGSAINGLTGIGAPDLTANIWLYHEPGKSLYESVRETIADGRNGNMPAQAGYLDYGKKMPANYDALSEEEKASAFPKVHLVAAYIYSLNQNK